MLARRDDMAKVFSKFRGSHGWAAKRLNVSRPTVSKYLAGVLSSRMLDEEIPRIAALLEETGGKCIDSANGKSVRSQLRRIRARRKRGTK